MQVPISRKRTVMADVLPIMAHFVPAVLNSSLQDRCRSSNPFCDLNQTMTDSTVSVQLHYRAMTDCKEQKILDYDDLEITNEIFLGHDSLVQTRQNQQVLL